MVSALITLIVVIIIVGIVAYLVTLLVDMIPMDGGFKRVAKVLIILVAVLIVILRALPRINASLGV